MRAIELQEIQSDIPSAIDALRVVDKPIPKPGYNQVLVKIEAAPCNPSDLLFLIGHYGVKKKLPTVPGWEGAGTVVESGGGPIGWWLKGKRVACAGQGGQDGTWAEYYLADARSCIPLSESVSFEQGSTLLINPFTAVGLMDAVAAAGHKAVIQTAGLSQVARMVQTLARLSAVPVINIVRRDEQCDALTSAGEQWVLNSTAPYFYDRLKQTAEQLNATVLFDAVGGEITGRLLSCMPDSSEALLYGALAGESCSHLSPLDLIFRNKSLRGFWLTRWIQQKGVVGLMRASRKIQKLMGDGEFETAIRGRYSFDQWKEGLIAYSREMSTGKVLLTP